MKVKSLKDYFQMVSPCTIKELDKPDSSGYLCKDKNGDYICIRKTS